MPQPKSQEEKQEHHHVWKFDGYAQDNCVNPVNGEKCKWIRVSKQEYDRRTDDWNLYHEAVRESDSYKDFIEMKNAYLNRDFPKMKEIKQRIESRCKLTGEDYYGEPMYEFEKYAYMEKPIGPDPAKYSYYQMEGAQV